MELVRQLGTAIFHSAVSGMPDTTFGPAGIHTPAASLNLRDTHHLWYLQVRAPFTSSLTTAGS